MNFLHPVLTLDEAVAFEKLHLPSKERQWLAMNDAGRAIAWALMADFREFCAPQRGFRVLLLVGKGHNGGDALLAGAEILRSRPHSEIYILPARDSDQWRGLTQRAFSELEGRDHVFEINLPTAQTMRFDVCIDGIVGMRYREPLEAGIAGLLEQINRHSAIRFRVAVDSPSGMSETSAFRADFTYATGILKRPLLALPAAGRVRYLDLGFFDPIDAADADLYVVAPNILAPLRGLRDPQSDKRSFGHVVILGGSREMPGALILNVMAALKAGAGKVTALAPESIVGSAAATVPEAMWVPMPETEDGHLALEGKAVAKRCLANATVLIAGSGLGQGAETAALLKQLVSETVLPIVLDADALQPTIKPVLGARPKGSETILTPHLGEFARLSEVSDRVFDSSDLGSLALDLRSTIVLKGPLTYLSDGERVAVDCFGGPVLARGGSGDLLAGITGAVLGTPAYRTELNQTSPAFHATCIANAWFRMAADSLARETGPTAVRSSELLGHLAHPLR